MKLNKLYFTVKHRQVEKGNEDIWLTDISVLMGGDTFPTEKSPCVVATATIGGRLTQNDARKEFTKGDGRFTVREFYETAMSNGLAPFRRNPKPKEELVAA